MNPQYPQYPQNPSPQPGPPQPGPQYVPPQSQPPAPPPQTYPPTPPPQPQYGPPQPSYGTPRPAPQAPQPATPQKNKLLWLGTGLLTALLIIAGAWAAFGKHGVPKANTAARQAALQAAANLPNPATQSSIAANYLNDFNNVCQGKTISNATDYKTGPRPHLIVLYQTASPKSTSFVEASAAENTIGGAHKDWLASGVQQVTKTQLVGCLTMGAEPASTKKCSYTDSLTGKTSDIPFYPVTYSLKVYEAKSGKVITTSTIAGNSGCPTAAAYDPSNPKVYALPDAAAIEKVINSPVTSS